MGTLKARLERLPKVRGTPAETFTGSAHHFEAQTRREDLRSWPNAVVRYAEATWKPDARLWAEALASRPKGKPTEADVRNWIAGPLRRYIPFRVAIAAHGRLDDEGMVVSQRIAVDYSPEMLARLPTRIPFDGGGCVQHLLETREPVVLDDPANLPPFATGYEIDLFRNYDLGPTIVDGVADPVGGRGFYVVLSGMTPEIALRSREAMETVVPVLHTLLLRSLEKPPSKLEEAGLTPRQIEIARMAAKGLDDKTIARKIGISEHGVAHHLRGIYDRLGVRRRSKLASIFV